MIQRGTGPSELPDIQGVIAVATVGLGFTSSWMFPFMFAFPIDLVEF